jgi:hypothetical protein
MNLFGLVLGAVALLLIAVFHVLVVKVEYHWGARAWPVFLVTGLVCVTFSLLAENNLVSGMLGVTGIFLFWSIREILEQEERVKKGWYPGKPKKHK